MKKQFHRGLPLLQGNLPHGDLLVPRLPLRFGDQFAANSKACTVPSADAEDAGAGAIEAATATATAG